MSGLMDSPQRAHKTNRTGPVPLMDVSLTHAESIDANDAGVIAGVRHALRLAGLDARSARPGAGSLSIVFGTANQVDELLGSGTRRESTVVFPLPGSTESIEDYLKVRDRVGTFWTATSAEADTLNANGAAACPVGVSTQLGTVYHRARRSLSLRDEDFVFFFAVTRRTPVRLRTMVRDAWQALDAAVSSRYRRATLYVSVGAQLGLDRWISWAESLCERASVVVRREPANPQELQESLALCDAEISARAGSAFPWTEAQTALRGRPLITLDPISCGDPCAVLETDNLYRADSATDLQRVLLDVHEQGQVQVHRRFENPAARRIAARCSSRNLAARMLQAIREAGDWDGLVAGFAAHEDADRD